MNPCKICGSYDLNTRAFKYGFDVYYLVECVACRNKKASWTKEEATDVWDQEQESND